MPSGQTMHHIEKTSEYLLCSLCGKKGESVQNLGSECEKLAPNVRNWLIDIAVLADVRVGKKERKKVEKHPDLKREIGRLW